ncbi:MAG: bifunctional pyr operon transcriptional regulator/uracil phosphoribosyltransferase PyrR [Sedimentisphaerales bacterium]|nr:bifunctional pyr operon transcriptional regulator/uracil phosphoribosyltransferase PyrR [Sedimentisphaerales bacterium]
MQVVCDEIQIGQMLADLVEQIVEDLPAGVSPALVGIRSRGETLAERLRERLQTRFSEPIDCGTLDITLYRDDLNRMGYQQPVVRATEIDFAIDDRFLVLVDDVLNTGRSVRAALDALIDLGRPRAIRLAVLIDRGQRELPIRADYAGRRIDALPTERVHVYLREVDSREEVVLE